MIPSKFYYLVIFFLGVLMIAAATIGHFPDLFDFESHASPSKEMTAVFNHINQQLKQAHGIIVAEDHRLLFFDTNYQLHEYCFEYGALWYNEYPVLKDLNSFAFEYRNVIGYRLASAQSMTDLKSIGYTLCIDSVKKNLVASHFVDLDQSVQTSTYQQRKMMTAMASLSQ